MRKLRKKMTLPMKTKQMSYFRTLRKVGFFRMDTFTFLTVSLLYNFTSSRKANF
jgi:hypothetical protein